jgi:hypothetical protein
MSNYTLKYRTFDQLMDEVKVDFQNYNLENFIEPHTLIKVAKRVNYDLGLRIFQTKEAVLELDNGRVKLPDDFYVLNFALICDEKEVVQYFPQGTHIEERPLIPRYQSTPATINTCEEPTVNCTKCVHNPCECPQSCETEESIDIAGVTYNPAEPYGNYCNTPRVYLDCKNNAYELIQIVKSETYRYKRLIPVKVSNDVQTIDCDCPNLYVNSSVKIWIKDNYVYSNVKNANLYLNYQGMMQDEDGNLLVPDHDLLNEYYEYAIKQRIIENLIMNDETPNKAKIEIIEARYRASRNNAKSLVNTPNFSELKKVWEVNRKAQYNKYFNMFRS